MLYFICFPKGGFVCDDKGACTHNIRYAKPFESFDAADDFARDLVVGKVAYAILANCVGR